MQFFIVLTVCVAVTVALPFIDKNTHTGGNNGNGGHRHKRENAIKYGIEKSGHIPYLKHEGTIINNQEHSLKTHSFANKDFINRTPIKTGADIQYQHKQSGSGLALGATHVPSGGTKLGATGSYNLYRNGNFGVDLKGNYGQTFNSPHGHIPPVWGVEIQGGYAFPRRG